MGFQIFIFIIGIAIGFFISEVSGLPEWIDHTINSSKKLKGNK